MSKIFEVYDWLALIWFIACWGGYTYFAAIKQTKIPNIARSLSQLRGVWMSELVTRDMRIADTTALGILQRTVTFFASTTVLILAGLLAVLGASDQAMKLVHTLPFVAQHSQAAWEMKVLVMIVIFIYAFFKFSWSVRQYNFALVTFGAAPPPGAPNLKEFTRCANALLTSANNSFNYGLRTYTFSMATIAWFVNPFLFMICTTWVVGVLYRREFHSRTLKAMKAALKSFQQDPE